MTLPKPFETVFKGWACAPYTGHRSESFILLNDSVDARMLADGIARRAELEALTTLAALAVRR